MHALHELQVQLLPRQGGHRETRLRDGLAFTLDVAPLVGIEAPQIVIEAAIVTTAPEALLIQPGGTAGGFGEQPPLGIDVEEVAAEDSVVLAEGIDRLHQHGGELRDVLSIQHMDCLLYTSPSPRDEL